MKKIIASILIFTLIFNNLSVFSNTKKDESDTIINAVTSATSQISSLPGLQNAKRVGVLVVRTSTAGELKNFSTPSSFFLHKRENFLSYIPVFNILNFFVRGQQTSYYSIKGLEGETSLSHNPLVEDMIIKELISLGKFEVVETIPNFYGNLQELMIEGQSLTTLLENPSKIANIGKLLGVDTIIVGNAAGSMMKYYTRENFLYIKDYFTTNVKLNLRTVDVATGKVTSSAIYSGKDTTKVFSTIKPEGVILIIGLVWAFATALKGE